MSRAILIAVIGFAICCVSGCGGGSGSGGNPGTTSVIKDTATRFIPKNTTITAGNSVQFVNSDTETHKIVSGTLEKEGDPSVIHNIIITSTGFSPSSVQANWGDTIQFSNNQISTFTIDILNEDETVLATFSIDAGMQQTFDFQNAGLYIIQKHNNSAFRGVITLFGSPNPSGVFQTPELGNGGTFLVQFNNPGAFPFFDENLSNPNRSFKTGTINVQ